MGRDLPYYPQFLPRDRKYGFYVGIPRSCAYLCRCVSFNALKRGLGRWL